MLNEHHKKEQEDFLRHLDADPHDPERREIYADWLEEHGEIVEAERMRKWRKAHEWMIGFAKKCGHTCTNYGENIIQGMDAQGRLTWEVNPDIEENWVPITYEMVLQAGRDYVTSDGNEWLTQQGSETARDLMWEPETTKAYWDHWEILTGMKRLGDEDEHTDHNPFSCSC